MSGNLCGYVVRAGTWQPVVGAVIEGSGQAPRVRSDRSWADGSWLAPQVSSLTDAAGRFMFDDLRQGEWLVRVEGAGGETLGKAVVHVLNNALSEITIEVSGPFAPPPAYPHLPDAGRPAPMQPPSVMGSIRGRVVSAADARPVADATITVVFGAGPAPDIAPITNEDGWFAMDDLPCGRWRLRASGPGGEIGEAAVEVFDDALSEVTIEPDGSPRRGWPDRRQPGAPDIAPDAVASGHGNVRGWVLRAGTGQPVAGCAVAATGGPAMTEQATLDSDGAGQFDFGGRLMAGDWLVRARSPDRSEGETPVRVFAGEESEITIEVESPTPIARRPPERRSPARPRDLVGSVRGRVVRASDGEPFGEATIMVVSGPGAAPDVAPLTDREGWFVLDDLSPGDWRLRAVGPNGETGDATAHVSAGALNEVTIALGRVRRREPPAARAVSTRTGKRRRAVTGTVRGRVVRADNGAAIADATITVAGDPGAAPDIAPITGADGSFVLDGLTPGEWQLAAVGPEGETGRARVTVAAGSVASALIRVAARAAGRSRRR
jgi:hypothetical protein